MSHAILQELDALDSEHLSGSSDPPWDQLWTDCHVATLAAAEDPYGIILHGAVATWQGRLAWIGKATELPGPPDALAKRVESLGGRWLTPGLVDCHTHLVFGGDRAGEFEQRLQGVAYEEIARQGGGIASSVRATREASEQELVDSARPRLQALLDEGVTTVEIKSGYGLDLATELRMLRAAKRLGEEMPVTLRTTFLGAHAVPPEYRQDADAYVDQVCDHMLPRVAAEGLADAVDAFCEGIAFSPRQVARVFEAADRLKLPVKLHADQLSDLGGAALAARFSALSADHLEYTSSEGARAMGEAGTVAVLLPGAFYMLRETQAPPVAAFREHGVPMALATDCNPGSAPVLSLLAMASMGCTLFRMTPGEALAGITRVAAQALGLDSTLGSLTVGRRADLAVWNIHSPVDLCYWLGSRPNAGVIRGGRWVRRGF